MINEGLFELNGELFISQTDLQVAFWLLQATLPAWNMQLFCIFWEQSAELQYVEFDFNMRSMQ